MALPLAEAHPPARRWSFAHAWQRLVHAVEAYPIERLGLAVLAAGVVLRISAPFFMDLRSDGDTYSAMGHAWMVGQEFLMPYGDVTTWAPGPPGYSNHYPPAYPFFLGIVFSVFGFGLWQAKWAAVFVALASIAAVYATTRDLYGRTAGALAGGIVAVEPHLLWVTGAGFSENMVLLFFALTMWAIVRSLKDDRYIVLAGLFAGLTYLSRASVGYFFVVAGTGGFFWRLAYRGWGVLANRWYLSAIALFGGIMAAWAYRNVSLFGYAQETVTVGPALLGGAAFLAFLGLALTLPFAINSRLRRWPNFVPGALTLLGAAALAAWAGALALAGDAFARTLTFDVPLWETSSYTRYVQDLAIERSGQWRHALVAKVPFFLAFLGWYAVPFLPETWKATKRVREEETSALWLSIFLVWVIAWIIAGMFWVFEQSSLYWLDNRRYVLIGYLPLLWLVLRGARVERASFRARYVLLALSLVAACGATVLSPVKFSDLRAAEHMDPYLRPGDEIAVDGNTIKYAFYAYLSEPREVQVYGWGQGLTPHFIVTLKGDVDYGDEYTRVGEFRQTYWNGGVMTAYLLARDDVVAERGIATGVVISS